MRLPADSAKLAQQKADFNAVVAACPAVTRCVNVTPYDENYQPKPACYGIAQALGGTRPVSTRRGAAAVRYRP